MALDSIENKCPKMGITKYFGILWHLSLSRTSAFYSIYLVFFKAVARCFHMGSFAPFLAEGFFAEGFLAGVFLTGELFFAAFSVVFESALEAAFKAPFRSFIIFSASLNLGALANEGFFDNVSLLVGFLFMLSFF